MAYVNNKELNISKIHISPNAKCFCPIGKDWYTNMFTIEMVPDNIIPDYVEVDEFVQKSINGKDLLIEQAVNTLYNFMKETYQPKSLKVSSSVGDAAHSYVFVTKEDQQK